MVAWPVRIVRLPRIRDKNAMVGPQRFHSLDDFADSPQAEWSQ